jgi:DNA modification methylase
MFLPPLHKLQDVIGQELRALREIRQVTQRRLAEMADLDQDTVCNLEAGCGTVGSLTCVLGALDAVVDGCPNTAELGRWIAQLRRDRGLSLVAATKKTSLSKPTLIKLERGQGRIDSLLAALRAYDVQLHLVPKEAQCSDEILGEPSSSSAVVQHGDAADLVRNFGDETFDAVITDPPYGLGDLNPRLATEIVHAWISGQDFDFAGFKSYMRQGTQRDWDDGLPQPSLWREVNRLLKPGGHALVFAAPRNADLVTLSLRLAGIEVRDVISWIYKTGFKLGMDVGRTLAMRQVRARLKETGPVSIERRRYPAPGGRRAERKGFALEQEDILRIAPEAASILAQHSGVRSHLKPAHEAIIVARKPIRGFLADNVARYGVGGLNIDAARSRSPDGPARYPMNVIGELDGNLRHYFYSPKVSAAERDRYLPQGMKNAHQTVKPVDLMRWLIRLVAQPGSKVLDPFAGSGTTGIACILEGYRFIGIEREAEYVALARARIEGWLAHSCAIAAE